MKYNLVTRCLLTCLLLLNVTLMFAHKGGHYHKHDGTVFSEWHLKNGQVIQGNFSKSQEDFIWLEQEEGKVVIVALSDLSPRDREVAYEKIKRFSSLNAASLQTTQVAIPGNRVDYFSFSLSILIAGIFIFIIKQATLIYKKNIELARKATWLGGCLLIIFASSYACKKTIESLSMAIQKTSPAFIDSAFAPYKPAVSTRWDENYFYVASNGLPAHHMMVGITAWQQQVPIPQNYTGANSWSIPLQPAYAAVPLSTRTNFLKGAIALAVNGVPIFNALNNRGEDAYLIGELDDWGGHCGRGDDYHYHTAPLHLSTTSGLKPIAFALDGFAVYGTAEPDGTAMKALDTCHGHIGSNGIYHYHGTNTYPYVIGAMKGKVVTDPSTPAPGNQILPQAFSSPLRPAGNPLRGARITACVPTGTNAYKLTYQRGAKSGYVQYSWDANNKYTFILTDTAGNISTSVYQR